MEKYICPECGNDKYFYYDVTIPAKQKFNAKTGKLIEKPYDIDKNQTCCEYEIVYCFKCGEEADFINDPCD